MAVVASLAAGIGYGIGNSDQLLQPKDTGTPRYGTAKDFEKVQTRTQYGYCEMSLMIAFVV